MATIVHGECGKSWSGAARAHCSGCHETFSTYLVSDRHRVGEFGVGRRCADPASVGLVNRNGIWGGPSPDRPIH
jgi:hypothetical protein